MRGVITPTQNTNQINYVLVCYARKGFLESITNLDDFKLCSTRCTTTTTITQTNFKYGQTLIQRFFLNDELDDNNNNNHNNNTISINTIPVSQPHNSDAARPEGFSANVSYSPETTQQRRSTSCRIFDQFTFRRDPTQQRRL